MERIEEKEMAAASADASRATDTSVAAVEPASALPTSAMSAQALAAMAAGEEIDPAQFEFGGMLASQIGADMSDERDGKKKDPEELEREEAMRAAARPQDWKAKLAEMDFEARVDATVECLGRKNNQKEILGDLLEFCREERTEEETEAFLQGHKQFADGYHSASKYLLFMQRTGAIEELEYDCEGVLITDEMRDELRELGAPEEEITELAVEWHYRLTDAGEEALNRFNPVDRTRAMLETQAVSRHASYARLLEFCETPRSLQEITTFMANDPGLERDPRTGVMHMQPSAYIGKLDQAGALTWENGWKTTAGGMEVLSTMTWE